MVDIQKGTTKLPILVKPRINGKVVTVTDIKTKFSNKFVDDVTTPIAFTLEYRERADASPTTQTWDSVKSSDTVVFFDMPDTFYANFATFTILIFWTISTEKIYSDEAMIISVKDLHRGV